MIVLVRFPPLHPFSIGMEGGRSQGGVVTPSSVTSEQQVCDLLHDAAMISDVVTVVADLRVTVLLCQVVHQVVGTVQVQHALAVVHCGGNQNFVAHGVSFELQSL